MLSDWYTKLLEIMTKEETRIKKEMHDLFACDLLNMKSINKYLELSTEERLKKNDMLITELVELQLNMGEVANHIYYTQRREKS